MFKENNGLPLTRNALKIIACIAMLCDHIGKSYVVGVYGLKSTEYMILCNMVGRIAFPIFFALFVQGIIHTKKELKHTITLGIFAILSEPCFDKALYHTWLFKGHQNVMLSWFLSCITIIILKRLYDFYKSGKLDIYIFTSLYVSVLFIIMSISVALKVDYSKFIIPITGIVFIIWKIYPELQLWIVGGIICVTEAIIYKSPGTVIAIPFMMLYDSNKIQPSNIIQKYSFYIFYPLHLLILGLIT